MNKRRRRIKLYPLAIGALCLLGLQFVTAPAAQAYNWSNHYQIINKGLGESFGPNTKWYFYYDSIRPDRDQWYGLPSHCDGGDYLTPEDNGGEVYPVSRAEANQFYGRCVADMVGFMKQAVTNAGRLVTGSADEGYRLDESQLTGGSGYCKNYNQWTWRWNKEKSRYEYAPTGTKNDPRAKCQVLASFGRQLHSATDFYAHTNYTDRANPGTLSIKNPPGLDRSDPAPLLETYSLWKQYRNTDLEPQGEVIPENAPQAYTDLVDTVATNSDRIPERLTSGCWNYGSRGNDSADKCTDRILESPAMEKDSSGKWRSYNAPGNFERAATVAQSEVQRQWEGLVQAFKDTYGPERAKLIEQAMASE